MKKLTQISTALFVIGFSVSLATPAKVTVFAAASMKDVLQNVAADYARQNPKNNVVFSFASSSTLAKQIEEGAPADIFISASNKWMKYLSEKNLTVKETEKVLAGNELVLIAPVKSAVDSVDISKGEWVNALKDSYLSVGDPAHVPAGQYAEEALIKLNLWDKVKDRLARAKDVRAALVLVERAETPYGIVYSTDAKVSQKVKTVGVFPAESYQPIAYPMAILKEQDNANSRDFLKYLASDAAKKVFESYCFSVK
ncbi:molybdate ABC transporter substrate-binding protein [Rodentibacter pneumotropicus]|uniref:Molybdate ABC transporter substrate-binding protein n=1 Tax=Rodentibacter pneumotropicus TaxID=758 RepID=A0A4S2QKY5_9PAST|nr:molybdate ABC transporter substrate-binding protein [Rodentibacter pneumotropicus]TGZ98416.1 molybdate ABC transporter substrate-binding protein [Rodentibacter pneumotropicus]TGZ99401.1 molybdate ABC transporter substrate-binding protein [Rodentibacter pneumotropicus]THA08773.1 molybdate ABC transporter substrate-binding protein [Rodentibacter pneumotropicus]THA16997.1 molybdate ABC transporter substrate-binding protein [Rodentibacter pneumotropicus]